jgi:quinoprotein glucose dehydrogenase
MIGVRHPGRNQHANSVLALDAQTGRLVWTFQEVRHDIWDLDIPAPPNLVTVTRDGQRVDAVAQVTKLGNTLLLDRLTGKPLFPFSLRRAPSSGLPGEQTWAYQPDVRTPQPFSRMDFRPEDITRITPSAHDFVKRQLRNATYGWFQPFVLDRPNVFFGIAGGAEWTGAAFDAATGWLYVSANHVPWMITVAKTKSEDASGASTNSPGRRVFLATCAMCHGEHRQGLGHAPPLLNLAARLDARAVNDIVEHGRNTMPAQSLTTEQRADVVQYLLEGQSAPASSPVAGSSTQLNYTFNGFQRLVDDRGYPGSTPPWGTLNAIDLNSGRIAWRVPLGEHEELTRERIPKTGTYNFGGATVTAGGLVFCAGTMDEKIRAFDKSDGVELWSYKLPFGGYAPPTTYEVRGRQYVVIAATGGGKLGTTRGDTYVAFSLPSRAKQMTSAAGFRSTN